MSNRETEQTAAPECIYCGGDHEHQPCELAPVTHLCESCGEQSTTVADRAHGTRECLPCYKSALEHGHCHGLHTDTRFDFAPVPDCPLCFGQEQCPGCGCLPGDGVTEGCTHPDGCGAFSERCTFCHGDHAFEDCDNIDAEQYAAEMARRESKGGAL
jgi:hypothetical protein